MKMIKMEMNGNGVRPKVVSLIRRLAENWACGGPFTVLGNKRRGLSSG